MVEKSKIQTETLSIAWKYCMMKVDKKNILFFTLFFLNFFIIPKYIIARPSKEEKNRQSMFLRSLFSNIFDMESTFDPELTYHEQENFKMISNNIDSISKVFNYIKPTIHSQQQNFITKKITSLKDKHQKKNLSLQDIFVLKQSIIEIFEVNTAPAVPLQRTFGQNIYRSYCSSCHGIKGTGDGSLSTRLPTIPTNFTNQKFMQTSSPLKILNKMLIDKKDNPLHHFEDQLTNSEMWNVSFYIQCGDFNLNSKFNTKEFKFITGKEKINFSKIGRWNNQELWNEIKKQNSIIKNKAAVIQWYRCHEPFKLNIARK